MSFSEVKTNTTEFVKDNLLVKIFPNRKTIGEKAAREVSEVIRRLLEEKDELNMIFAAAPSQSDFMQALIADNSIPWQRINAFHMDEYIGLEKKAPQGFGNFLKERLFGKVPFKSVNYINGQSPNAESECNRYSKLLEKFPADIVCLGIGENGHIAFNDPPVADFNDAKLVKVAELDLPCRQQQVNEKLFTGLNLVPTHAVTLTIPALMKADYMFCMVPAVNKAEAVYKTLNGEINEECPATILRTKEKAILYLDRESASLLK